MSCHRIADYCRDSFCQARVGQLSQKVKGLLSGVGRSRHHSRSTEQEFRVGPVSYSDRRVPSHGSVSARVLLVNEAPGPDEDKALVPSFGQQGASVYHALRRAGVHWALAFPTFRWPKSAPLRLAPSLASRVNMKRAFLEERARHITCTNAFDRLPRPTDGSAPFCAPLPSDVCSPENLARLAAEIHTQHSVALVCGISAYLVVTGNALNDPSKREYTVLTANELSAVNTRLKSNLRVGWYMGHTRRWSLKPHVCSQVLQAVASVVGWERRPE